MAWNPREFQATINAFLANRGWSQAELSRASGLSVSVINRWLQPPESGDLKQPTGESLEKLAMVIGIPHMELMRMAGRLGADTITTNRPVELQQFLADMEAGFHAADPERRMFGMEIARAALPAHKRRPDRRGRPKKGLISLYR